MIYSLPLGRFGGVICKESDMNLCQITLEISLYPLLFCVFGSEALASPITYKYITYAGLKSHFQSATYLFTEVLGVCPRIDDEQKISKIQA